MPPYQYVQVLTDNDYLQFLLAVNQAELYGQTTNFLGIKKAHLSEPILEA